MAFRPAIAAVSVIGWVVAMPGMALADPSSVQAQSPRPAADPNQRICETETVIGSRLATRKICGTRAEWAERRKQDRQTVEEIQRLQGQPCINSTVSSGAAPTC